jgi:hypothetical protein
MTVLRFKGGDPRWLFEILVEAVEVTGKEGERPSIIINGKTYAPFDLVKVAALLPEDSLQPHHQLIADELFKKRQSGYRRTAYNLAHLANSIASTARSREAIRRMDRKGGRSL